MMSKNLNKKVIFSLFCLFQISFCLPTANQIDEAKLEEIQHQLLNPQQNDVLDHIDSDPADQQQHEAPVTKDLFPDREGFITGHRIPLELFSQETRERIQEEVKQVKQFLENAYILLQNPVELLQNPVELLQNPLELQQNPVELDLKSFG